MDLERVHLALTKWVRLEQAAALMEGPLLLRPTTNTYTYVVCTTDNDNRSTPPYRTIGRLADSATPHPIAHLSITTWRIAQPPHPIP